MHTRRVEFRGYRRDDGLRDIVRRYPLFFRPRATQESAA
ncbi:hypothetical protein Ttaiw_02227 [Tepidimonas taiwanensis]|uniref:Uncharacterized protein n=1 Tax=Tepidimonas taiwanensis TaxID=307486 RepID=A0A554X180_9BURK|nr:DUF2889 domain-containing protein [Tepidimonas taiwanensis]MCX7693650.1 DUF2889 domain-containing protein [Tepidimonas taiwanensis]MDM7463358.1 DUF2889 domain-containing protein [Tepidimonas taiwanensis]TSE29599.1 hypothetical protein Ttaiw_02227 [Tepidimonas taiwanensis]